MKTEGSGNGFSEWMENEQINVNNATPPTCSLNERGRDEPKCVQEIGGETANT